MIQRLLGHNDLKTTLRYLHMSNKDLLKIKSPLDDLKLTQVVPALPGDNRVFWVKQLKIINCKYCFPLKVAYNSGNITLAVIYDRPFKHIGRH